MASESIAKDRALLGMGKEESRGIESWIHLQAERGANYHMAPFRAQPREETKRTNCFRAEVSSDPFEC